MRLPVLPSLFLLCGGLLLAALVEKDVDMRPTQGNTVTLIADGAENWELLKDEFRKAEKAIYVEPYRFRLDTCGTVLAGILAARWGS